MTRTTPELTAVLLDRALALPATREAPADLHASIAAAIRQTPQRPAPLSGRIAATYGGLPRPARIAITAMLLLAIVAGLAAIGAQLLRQRTPLDDSLTFRGDVARTGVVNGPGPGAAMALAFTQILPGQIVMSPAIVDAVAYVGAVDGRFRAFDLRRRVEIWSIDVDVAWSSPSIAGDFVIVGTEDRDLVAVHRDSGVVAWRVPLGAFATGSPAVAGDHLYVATSSAQSHGRAAAGGTGKVIALDLATHTVAWQEDLPGPSTHSISVTDSILVVPTDVGIAVAFDAATGRELWRFPTPSFTDTPVIAAGKVFLAGLDLEGTRGALWAVDLRSGQELWHHTRPSQQTILAPAVDPANRILYAGTVDGDVIALRVDDGTEVWTHHLGAEIAAPPTKAGEVLYVASSGGISALDAATGQVFGTVPIDGIPSSPAIADGYLVTGTQSGTLYVLADAGAAALSSPAITSPIVPTATTTSSAVLPSVTPLHEVWRRTANDLGMAMLFYTNIAPDGRLWIADAARGRFVILDSDGAVADTWQPTGAAALDLVQPDNDPWGAVAFAPDGGFFVADTDHQRVLRFGADRRLIGSWGSFGPGPGEFVSPFGITVGPDGLVYVVDDPTCRVQVFEPSGVYLHTLAGGAEFVDRCTNNLIVESDGSVYLASGGRGDPWRITVFGPDGAVIRRIGEGLLREPVLIAPGPDGEIYATDGTDRLHLFDANGDLQASWSGAELELVVVGPGREVYASGPTGVVRRYSLAPGDQP
jgi:outer membrane protein assembly factor BamB/sugar lactone lactonase YvrE